MELEISEKKKKNTKILYVGVIVILILIFVVGFIWGLFRVLALEGTFPPPQLTEGLSPAPQNAAEAAEYFSSSAEKALREAPKFVNSHGVSIDFDEAVLSFSGAEYPGLYDTMSLVSDGVEEALEAQYETVERGFSEGFEDVFYPPELDTADIGETGAGDFSCSYIYYVCPSCGAKSDEHLSECDECGSDREYETAYRDDYTVTLVLWKAGYGPAADDSMSSDVADELAKGLEGFCNIVGSSLKMESLQLVYRVERETDELRQVSFVTDYTATVECEFIGDYAEIGTVTVTVPVRGSEDYYFTWPSLRLNKDYMYIEPRQQDNLLATLTCDKPTEMTVVWTSSDESVMTVDDEGYMKAGKEPGTAVVTASFEFNGKTYSDSCEIEIKIPVESSAMSKRSLKLQAGQTGRLEVKVGPSDATHKGVTWYTEDPGVATVDEGGLVTAVSAGKTTVYSLTDDGWYKSSCEVTVS
ncbi:MAG: Ig-like domain-containing protein [Clostridia bacterium]|nr:Ig-like domain-containing protein [Clostridia bacterium]